MQRIHRFFRTIIRLLYTFYFYTIFLFITSFYYLFGFIFLQNDKKKWQKLALNAVDTIFFLTGIRPKVTGLDNIGNGPFILSSNHQSFFDGFIIMHVTRILFVAITAPLEVFPPFISWWFEKVGYISVARDEYEEVHYQEKLKRSEVVDISIKELANKNSILIFPEGKRERNHRLLPFHKGVSKIAFESGIPVTPIIIKNADHFFPIKRTILLPCQVEIIIEKPIMLHEKFKDIDEATIFLEKLTEEHLPSFYQLEESVVDRPNGHRAVFFDIDGTITKTNISNLIIKHYFLNHVNKKGFSKLTKYIFDKSFLKHVLFYKRSVKSLTGTSVDEFQKSLEDYILKHGDKIFYEEMLEIISLYKKRGDLVFLVTEEPIELVSPIAKFLDVKIVGTTLGIEDGRFTGKIVGPIIKGLHKKEVVTKLAQEYNIDLKRSYAYGNSWHDYEMLRAVGQATVINPSRSLAIHSKDLGFRIIH